MRALVKVMSMMFVGLFGLLVMISAGSMMLAIAIPKFGRELGYSPQTAVAGLWPYGGAWLSVLPMLAFVLMLLVVMAIVIAVMRITGREPARARSKENADETRLIQEIYHGLARMEQRVEALETLLLERVPSSRSVYAPDAPAQRTVR